MGVTFGARHMSMESVVDSGLGESKWRGRRTKEKQKGSGTEIRVYSMYGHESISFTDRGKRGGRTSGERGANGGEDGRRAGKEDGKLSIHRKKVSDVMSKINTLKVATFHRRG